MVFSYDGLSTPNFVVQLGADQREAGRSRKRALQLPAFPYLSQSSERPGAVKGARFVRGGEKFFRGLKRFFGAHLDGEDRSGTWGRRESGPGVWGVRPRGLDELVD